MKKVDKHTEAEKDGTLLLCPRCLSSDGNRTYHFVWSAKTCQNCGEMGSKTDWVVVDPKFETLWTKEAN